MVNGDQLDIIKAQFKAWDQDGDGTISYDELEFVMKKIAPTMTDDDIAILMKEIDTDGDGDISFDEFVEWIANPESSKAVDESGAISDFNFSEMLKPLFRLFDRDDGGSISSEEFEECAMMLSNSLAMHEGSDASLLEKHSFANIDADGDGEIDFQEFTKWQSMILKDSGIPKSQLPGLMKSLVESLSMIFEIDEAASSGKDVRNATQALEESIAKVAANATSLFSDKSKVSSVKVAQRTSSWCEPPSGFSLQLLSRKIAAELGVALQGGGEKKGAGRRRGHMQRSSSAEEFSVGGVKICFPGINKGKDEPAKTWFSRVTRINKEGVEEKYVYEWDVGDGKFEWKQTNNEDKCKEAFDALPELVQAYCLLKTQGKMGQTIKWTGVKTAIEEGIAMETFCPGTYDKYEVIMKAEARRLMEEEDEIQDLEDTGADVDACIVMRMMETEMNPIEALVGLIQCGAIELRGNGEAILEEMAAGCA
eukprot:TRINITY_DN24048_c0_g1_i1.p1 TRINITY_DN24048_c0_g1~~TRINITY_DN24048_c0_g1_i1.p1  ORF type:complete len:480 (-),score=103.28 TRINITY_DN24048_c0_g1_i1:476-1915(-)